MNESKLIEIYRNQPQELLRRVIKVSVIENSLLKTSNEAVFLTEERNGNYWIIATEDVGYCLLPKANAKINPFNLNTLKTLFECYGYQPEHTKEFTLIKPATVSVISNKQEWKLEKKGVLVFGKISLSSEFQSELGTKLESSPEDSSFLMIQIIKLKSKLKELKIEPKDLFLLDFFFIDVEDALPGSLLPNETQPLVFNDRRITPFIPLNPILLDYFTPEYLISKIQFHLLNESKEPIVRLILDLPLAGQDNNPTENHVLFKDYGLKRKNALVEVPVLEIWPYLRIKDWQEYYAFYYDGEYGEETFQVSFPNTKDAHIFQDGRGAYQIVRLEEFPSFIQCQDTNKKLLGLILLKTPKEVTPTGTWKVGVDFGYSFTNVYVSSHGFAGALPFDNLHCKVTVLDRETRNPALFEFFIPESFIPSEKPLPLANILTTRGNQNTSLGKKRPIFDGRIYVPNRQFKPDDSWMKTDLKLENHILTQLFLKQLALHITALAAKNQVKQIQWCLSYQSAFSPTEKSLYAQIWQDLTKDLQAKTGIKHICPNVSNLQHFRSQNLALAQYFIDKENYYLANAICIGMWGGGMKDDPSDISIWENNRLIHQCLLHLGEKELFSQFLKINSDFLQQTLEAEFIDWQKLKEEIFNANLDLFWRVGEENWVNNKRAFLAEDLDFQGLLQLIAMGTAGLYYYVGIILKVLHVEGKYSRNKITPVYVGGKGSRLFHWLATGGHFDCHSEINQLLSRMLSQGSGFPDTGETTQLSARPEDEVACGLVLDKTNLEELTRKAKDPLIAGEDCVVNCNQISWRDRFEFEGNIQQFEIPEFKHIRNFLDEFNLALKELEIDGLKPMKDYQPGVGLEPSYADRLWRDTQKELTNVLLNIRGEADNIRVEPPFILELKALLRVLGKEWAGKL